jgi:hypothetical protein
MTYPILEHDPMREAFIEPSKVNEKRNMPEHCVICFFMDIIERVASEHAAQALVENRWEDGPHPVYEIEYRDQRLPFFHPGIGSALSAGILEEVIAFGCSKFILGSSVGSQDMLVMQGGTYSQLVQHDAFGNPSPLRRAIAS